MHIDNIHAIHANDRILEAIEKVKEKQFIILEGKLVKLDILVKAGGERAVWESSLVQGTNECKVMYITKITLGNEVMSKAKKAKYVNHKQSHKQNRRVFI